MDKPTQQTSTLPKVHFSGLNGLRFYAALSVVIQHIMYTPNDWYDDPGLPDTLGRLFISSNDAVVLFFVLSGFLIVYLLLTEREHYGAVSVRQFYVRRILRIWPLYYLVIGVSVVVIPLLLPDFVNPFARTGLAVMLMTFLGNIGYVLYFPFPPLEHLWSIAIEEQFYLVVPHLLRFKIDLSKLFIALLLIYVIIWYTAQFFFPPIIGGFLTMIRYDCLAIGGLFACALYYRSPILKWIYHPVAAYGALAVFAYMAIFIHAELNVLPYTLGTCIIFGILILNVSTNEKFRLKLNHPLLEEGGKFSYGIYMYHPLILLLFRWFFISKIDATLYQIIIYPVVIGLTMVVSMLSYNYFEKRFLNLKERFSRLVNSPEHTEIAAQKQS